MEPIDMLCELLNCTPIDLEPIKGAGLYRWRGVVYELVHADKLTAPDSHYTKFEVEGQKWAIREVGRKSVLYKTIKKI
jgi:hypothetical protein